MEVLSSRILVAPSDLSRSVDWYTETLGLRIYREFGAGGETTGVVLFLGGGFLELSGSGGPPSAVTLWLQVPDVDAEHARLAAADVVVTAPPADMPWGLRECWIEGPDGERIVLVEVPDDHPIRRRVG
jgi:catechol 2,3-dioxygenase-like lactoylglutathione lyase family enzyme